MRSKLYQLAFLIIFLSFFSLMLKHYQGNTPAVSDPLPTEYEAIYATQEPFKSLDPAEANNLSEAKVLVNIFEGLVRFKPNSTDIEPCLATDWEVSADGRTWVFSLRKGVLFHDNTPFTAEAVKFTVERQLQPLKKDNMTYGNFTFGIVQSVEVVNDYTIKFTLNSSYSPFLRNLAMPWAAPIVSPASVNKQGDNFYKNPVGTGPYYLAGWDGENPVLMANNKYWGQVPKINSILFTYGPLTERTHSFNTGIADIADIPTRQLERVAREGNLILKQSSASLGYLGMYNDRPPFNNPRVRRALCVAIDRKEIAQKLFSDSSLAANSPLPPNILGYHKDLKPYSGGPKVAKELLKAAGFPSGLDITLINYNSPRPYNPLGSVVLPDLVKRQLAEAGIRVTIKSYAWHEFKTALNNQEGDAFLFGWVGDNMDPDNFLYTLLSSGGIPQTNLTKYKNSEVDRLITAAQKERDEAVRRRLYFHAQQIILQDTPIVFLNYGQDTIVVGDYIKELTLNPYGLPLFAGAYIKK